MQLQHGDQHDLVGLILPCAATYDERQIAASLGFRHIQVKSNGCFTRKATTGDLINNVQPTDRKLKTMKASSGIMPTTGKVSRTIPFLPGQQEQFFSFEMRHGFAAVADFFVIPTCHNN